MYLPCSIAYWSNCMAYWSCFMAYWPCFMAYWPCSMAYWPYSVAYWPGCRTGTGRRRRSKSCGRSDEESRSHCRQRRRAREHSVRESPCPHCKHKNKYYHGYHQYVNVPLGNLRVPAANTRINVTMHITSNHQKTDVNFVALVNTVDFKPQDYNVGLPIFGRAWYSRVIEHDVWQPDVAGFEFDVVDVFKLGSVPGQVVVPPSLQ